MFNVNPTFDFYDKTNLKSYNLDEKMQYQLRCLDSLDVFTRKHCENVANLTCRICEYLHCQTSFIEYCTICAYLHDIGKLFIPPAILQKPGKLTDEEYRVMKTHTSIGYKMCIRDEHLRPYAAGPLYHHEALNGSGYPKGLLKKDIPYEGQIIRVADEYDAIVSKRQYKSHVGITDTLKILIENATPREHEKYGKNNPLIVKVLLKVVIDDIEYEIYCTQQYVDYLKENIKRLETAEKYYLKMQNAKSKNKQEYFAEYTKMYLEKDETLDNFQKIKEEFEKAFQIRKDKINKLFSEIKVIKKLRV